MCITYTCLILWLYDWTDYGIHLCILWNRHEYDISDETFQNLSFDNWYFIWSVSLFIWDVSLFVWDHFNLFHFLFGTMSGIKTFGLVSPLLELYNSFGFSLHTFEKLFLLFKVYLWEFIITVDIWWHHVPFDVC